MSEDNRFEEVGGSSNNARWEPYKNDGNAAYPKEMIGYLKNVREQVGPNGVFEVATIQVMDKVNPGALGPEVDVSGGKVLSDKLNDIVLGSFICIKYLGKKPSKQGGRTYNDWFVGVDKNAIPFNQLGGVAKVAPTQESINKTPTGTVNMNPVAKAQSNSNVFGGSSSAPAFNESDLPF